MLLLVPLALAPAAMTAISLAERRFGPGVAGWLNAAPLSISIAILAVTTDSGAPAGAAVAEAAAAHVPAQVAFAAVFAAILLGSERGGAAALACATAAFAAVSAGIAVVPEPVAIGAAVPALVLGRRYLAGGAGVAAARDGGVRDVVLRAAIALAVVVAVLATVRASGPGLGGAVAAYPALTAALATMVGRARGPLAAAHLLRGVVQGLAGYLVFCVAVASAAPELGLIAAPLAVAACVSAYATTWRGIARVPMHR